MPTLPWSSLTDADWLAMTAVLYGSPTADDVAHVRRICSTPDGASMFAELQTDAALGGPRIPTRDDAVLRQRAEAILHDSTSVASPRRRPARSIWGAVSLGALVCLGVAFVLRGRDRHASFGAADHVYRTSIGQRASVRLADGSHVTLAPQTTLRVPSNFGDPERTLTVVGEAYFDVAHTAHTPFVVHAGATTTRVLGTAFDVRHYPADPAARIGVTNGKVVVSSDHRGSSVTMIGGDAATITDSTGVITMARQSDVNADWRDGRLVFHMAPVSEVLGSVSRWYGYQFHLADTAIAERHVTTTLNVLRSSTDVLDVLRLILDVDMSVDGTVITVRPRHRASVPVDGRGTERDSFSLRPEVGR